MICLIILTRLLESQQGIDIKEQKMTLPLIYAINNASSTDKSWLINSVKNHNKDTNVVSSKSYAYVKSHGGLEYAQAANERLPAKSISYS